MEDKNLVLMKFLDIEFKRGPVPQVHPPPPPPPPLLDPRLFMLVFRSLNK